MPWHPCRISFPAAATVRHLGRIRWPVSLASYDCTQPSSADNKQSDTCNSAYHSHPRIGEFDQPPAAEQ